VAAGGPLALAGGVAAAPILISPDHRKALQSTRSLGGPCGSSCWRAEANVRSGSGWSNGCSSCLVASRLIGVLLGAAMASIMPGPSRLVENRARPLSRVEPQGRTHRSSDRWLVQHGEPTLTAVGNRFRLV